MGLNGTGAVGRSFDRALRDTSAGDVGVVQYREETGDMSDAQGRALLEHKWYCKQVYAALDNDSEFDELPTEGQP